VTVLYVYYAPSQSLESDSSGFEFEIESEKYVIQTPYRAV